jgi:hypothetical protein
MRWRRSSWLVAGVLFLSEAAFSRTYAEAQQPVTDADLRASYCLVIKQNEEQIVRAVVDRMPRDARSSVSSKRLVAEANDNVVRLRAYLLPRMSTLDAAPLLAAAQRAKADLVEGSEASDRECGKPTDDQLTAQDPTVRNKFQACEEGVAARYSVIARMRRCNDLSWLPF